MHEDLPSDIEQGEKYIYEHVVFIPRRKKASEKILGYQSSSPDRKLIVLSESSVKPHKDEAYRVRILEDTNPEDSSKGYLIGEIVVESSFPFSEKARKEVEENVRLAEEPWRKRRRAARNMYEKTGVPRKHRDAMTGKDIPAFGKQKRIVEKAGEREKTFGQEAQELLGETGSPERMLVDLQKNTLVEALREEAAIARRGISLREEEAEILKDIKGEPSGTELEALDDIRAEMKQWNDYHSNMLTSSPEAYYGLHLKQLKEYKRQLKENKKDPEDRRIVETPYVHEQIDDIVMHLRAEKPVMLYGHLGSGKTELAMHVARHYLGKDALVISGSKHTSLAELYGHQVLAIDKIAAEEVDRYANEVGKKYEKWLEENEEKLQKRSGEEREAEKNRAHDRILQTYLTQFKSGTMSDFFMGPVYRAMAEGRPVIIDEVNAIPHEVLISLNHILTRKVGDKINVQQDTGKIVEVKDGFGVLMTGNLNQGQERYIDRQDMDPAFLSRLHKIEYDYLPQTTEGNLKDEGGVKNELFHVLLARMMDRNGNIEAPKDTIDKLWKLAQVARITQDVFSGKEINGANYFQQAGARPLKYLLKESVLSMRAIDAIITQWQKEGYKQEIDYYIYHEFIGQSTSPSDRAYMYQLFQRRFGFFRSAGWEQRPDYGRGGQVNAFTIPVPKNPPIARAFFGPRDVVDAAFGQGPERTEWPKGTAKPNVEDTPSMVDLEEIQRWEDFKEAYIKDLADLRKEVEEYVASENA